MRSNDLLVEERDGKIMLTSRLDQLTDKDAALRAKHMREDFQADRYPTVTLVVNRSDLRMPTSGQSAKGEAPGLLTLHGVTQPVRFGYAASETGGKYRVTGSTTIDYTKFLGRRISRFGITVEPPVTVEASFDLADS
jgi:polyisoprenoid-binding protein YceI